MRAAIREQIAAISPLDSIESQVQQAVLAWVDSGEELFRLQKPATPPRHLVAYFAVVEGDYLLLVDHINAELWLPTGGHVEPGEHPKAAVQREAKEELGIEADFLFDAPLFLTETRTVGKTAGHWDVSLWYVLRGDRQSDYVFDESEFRSLGWFHKQQVPLARSDRHMRRFLRKLYPAQLDW